VDVLFEKRGRHAGQIGGKTPYMQAVHIDGDVEFIGEILPVEIVGVGSNSLYGRLKTQPRRRRPSYPEAGS
jgi:tRNA-2-methylthio-N6-dimethylallyladenosine synthase